MAAFARRSLELLVALLAVASLVITAAPASAQVPGAGGPVSCEPANPEPGGQTECTAEGLEADSDYQWTAEFSGGTTESGDGTADADGVGTFTVDVPDEEGEYTVTVTGTGEDGEAYEESFTGEVGGGEGGLPLPLPDDSESPSEEPSDGGTESEGEDDGTGSDDGTSGGDDQVSPVPSGGVATGMGGMADDGPDALTVLAVLLVLGTAAGVALRRRRTDH